MKRRHFLFLAPLLPVSVLAGGNGGGYNGPDLNPTSVPVALDRGISIGDLSQAMYACLVAGDDSQGLVSILQQAMDQIQPGQKVQGAGILSAKPSPDCMLDDDGACVPMKIHYIDASFAYTVSGGPRPFSGQASFGFATNLQTSDYGDTLTFSLPAPGGNPVTLQTDAGAFPFVAYQKIFQDGGFDELGQHRDDRTIVEGLAIDGLPNQSGATMVKTENTATFKPAEVTLNVQEYAQCLISQIQR